MIEGGMSSPRATLARLPDCGVDGLRASLNDDSRPANSHTASHKSDQRQRRHLPYDAGKGRDADQSHLEEAAL